MNPDQIRIFEALLEDTRGFHRELVGQTETYPNHSALYQDESEWGPDMPCLACGHINEAEYALAEAAAALTLA